METINKKIDWYINEGAIFKSLNGGLHIPIETESEVIAEVHGENATKNAKLIVVAPKLLTALEEIVDVLVSCVGGSDPLNYSDIKDDVEMAIAIIKKAKGL